MSDRTTKTLARQNGAQQPPPETVEHSLEQAIGIEVRAHRKWADLTVAELAKAADISSGMLSKIENGQISASLNTLQMLSNALNLPLSALFSTYEQKRACSYVRLDNAPTVRRRGTKAGHSYQLLAEPIGGDVVVEPFLITLGGESEPFTTFQHEGLELIYMLTGTVEYAHGDRRFKLMPGDTLLFDSSAPHGPSAIDADPASYLALIVTRRS